MIYSQKSCPPIPSIHWMLWLFPQMHTKKCEYLKIPCVHSECGMLVKKSALQEHLENECICRPQKCDYCKKSVKLNLMEVSFRRSDNVKIQSVDT